MLHGYGSIKQDSMGPGTGALGGPPVQHNYKRAVQRPPPRYFTAEVLPPAKFGTGFCYGLRICPFRPADEQQDDGSSKSSKSAGSLSEYEVWRRWEDCLWFQDLLEAEYALMSRTKRQRLAAGKGVKKDGVYTRSDHAASFESLPPGPEANSVAKDIHQIVPKLTKKGTFFRASQATVDQRGREFAAMITALLAEDVPMLIKELRELRIVRDFFAVWRRDKDHERKMLDARPSSSGGNVRASVASSAFSMYFSASNISLQLPPTFSELPPSPAVPSHSKAPMSDSPGRSPTTLSPESPGSSSSTEFPHFRTPMSAPGMSMTVSDRGSLSLHIAEDESYADYQYGPKTAPSRVQSARWSHGASKPFPSQEPADDEKDIPVMFVPGGQPWSDPTADYGTGLQALPEDQELVPSMMTLALGVPEDVRPPVRRSRVNSCPDRANRNCLIFTSPPDSSRDTMGPESLDAVIQSLHAPPTSPDAPASGPPTTPTASSSPQRSSLPLSTFSADLSRRTSVTSDQPKTPTATDSSRPSSVALSTLSADMSRRSSWRTSVASDMSVTTGFSSTFGRDSCIDLDRALTRSPVSLYSPLASPGYFPPARTLHAPRASVSTMNSLISNSSVDAVLPRRASPPSPGDIPRRSLSAGSYRPPSFASMPIEEMWYEQQEDLLDAYFYDPSLRDSLVLAPEDPAGKPGRAPLPLHFMDHMATPDRFPKPFQNRPAGQFHLPWSPPAGDTFTLKAVLRESIVLLRIPHRTALSDVRARLRDKFAAQEDGPLPDAFALAYYPPPPPGDAQRGGGGGGRSRSSSVSTTGTDYAQPLRPVASEADWRTAVAGCAGKLTVRILDTWP